MASYRAPKISPFSRDDPQTWFLHAEITLRTAGITSSATKADYVAQMFDTEALQVVSDILQLSPRPADLYEQVKARVIEAYGLSSEARLRRMMKGQVPTTGKPSLIISRLRALGTGANEGIIRTVFLEQLPPPCRAVLSVSSAVDLDALGKMADKYVESIETDPNSIAAVGDARTKPPNSPSGNTASLEARVAALEKAMKRLNRARSRSRSRKPSDQNSQSSTPSKDGLCYIHSKYGSEARKCAQPATCTFDSGN